MKKFIILALFVILAVSTVFAGDYDEDLARYKLWPMASAAYSSNPGLCVKDNFADGQFIKQYSIHCDIFKNDTCSGFTAVSNSDKAIILIFRGTTETTQFIEEAIDEIFDAPSPFIGGGGVNKYFLDGFNSIWNGGMKNDFLTLKNKYSDYILWVTGHSLGGAMASIGAATISKLGYMPPEKIKLITYGEPRVGNSGYAAAVDSLVPYAFRVNHAQDMSPQLPPKGMFGYHHHKAEVWYNNDMAVGQPYVVCLEDEGEQCSDGSLDLNMDEHHYYFNVSYLFADQGCPGYNPNP